MNIYFILSIFFVILSVIVGCGVLSEIFDSVKIMLTGINECIDEVEKGENDNNG